MNLRFESFEILLGNEQNEFVFLLYTPKFKNIDESFLLNGNLLISFFKLPATLIFLNIIFILNEAV